MSPLLTELTKTTPRTRPSHSGHHRTPTCVISKTGQHNTRERASLRHRTHPPHASVHTHVEHSTRSGQPTARAHSATAAERRYAPTDTARPISVHTSTTVHDNCTRSPRPHPPLARRTHRLLEDWPSAAHITYTSPPVASRARTAANATRPAAAAWACRCWACHCWRRRARGAAAVRQSRRVQRGCMRA